MNRRLSFSETSIVTVLDNATCQTQYLDQLLSIPPSIPEGLAININGELLDHNLSSVEGLTMAHGL
jgi:hypothetical protein